MALPYKRIVEINVAVTLYVSIGMCWAGHSIVGLKDIEVVTVHIAVVVLLLVLLVVMVAAGGDGSGANIGAGLVLLPLIALGVPWSLVFFFDPYSFDDAPTVVFVLVSIAPAVLNIVLHWAIGRWLRKRHSAPV